MNVSGSGYEAATYHSGNGTAYFSFLYTVQPGDKSGDLEYWDEQAFKTEGYVRRVADEVHTPAFARQWYWWGRVEGRLSETE